jgi:hypothetical protein
MSTRRCKGNFASLKQKSLNTVRFITFTRKKHHRTNNHGTLGLKSGILPGVRILDNGIRPTKPHTPIYSARIAQSNIYIPASTPSIMSHEDNSMNITRHSQPTKAMMDRFCQKSPSRRRCMRPTRKSRKESAMRRRRIVSPTLSTPPKRPH